MSHSITLTWSPSETDITEIASYTIFRGVDGATPTLLLVCAVQRDFLGGIIGVEHCTTIPSIPHNDSGDSGSVYDKVTVHDAPVSYVDTTVTVGHTFCYYVTAQPMGNNQSVAQGPPSAPSNTTCVTVTATATAVVLTGQVINNNSVELDWTASSIEGSTISGYQVWRNQNGGAFILLTSPGNVLTYTDNAVVLGVIYGYFVIAVPVAGNNSPDSNTVFEQLSVFYTSQIYPIQAIESMRSSGVVESVATYQYQEGLQSSLLVESGTLTPGLLTYTNGLPEGIQNTALVESGTLILGLLTYTNGLPEGIQNSVLVESGTLALGLVAYTNWPVEGLTNTVLITSGSLT